MTQPTRLTTEQIDALLPELDNAYIRLIVQINQGRQGGIAAIDCDSKLQTNIADDYPQTYNFLCDLIGIDDQLAERYSTGHAIALGMSAGNWRQWLEAFPADGTKVWLTTGPEDGKVDYAFTALDMASGREVVVIDDHGKERPAFVRDCSGWTEASYRSDLSQVVRMSAENWQAWLEIWEVAELSDETAAALCN